MNCRRAKLEMALWVGDDLDDGAVTGLKQHLAGCKCCHSHWKQLKQCLKPLHDSGETSLPSLHESVWPELLPQLSKPSHEPRPVEFNGWIPAIAVLMTCTAITLFWESHPSVGDSLEKVVVQIMPTEMMPTEIASTGVLPMRIVPITEIINKELSVVGTNKLVNEEHYSMRNQNQNRSPQEINRVFDNPQISDCFLLNAMDRESLDVQTDFYRLLPVGLGTEWDRKKRDLPLEQASDRFWFDKSRLTGEIQ